MKMLKLAAGVLALAAPFAVAETSTWKADSAHSEVDFAIKHLGIKWPDIGMAPRLAAKDASASPLSDTPPFVSSH